MSRLQTLFARAQSIELSARQRRILVWAGYPLFALLVALTTFYVSLPRERLKDRLETALSADLASGQPLALGVDVNIGELTPTLFTGIGLNATDVILRTRPLRPDEKPARYVIDDLRVRVGLLSLLLGAPSYSFKAHALGGLVRGKIAAGASATRVDIAVEKMVLTGVPAIAQAVGGVPLAGALRGKLVLTLPKGQLATAQGRLDLDLSDLVLGDGKAKLTVPSDPFLAAGITFPRIRLGQLSGHVVIDKGHARLEGVRVHSPDADAMLDGHAELRDPIAATQLSLYLKLRPAPALVKREPTVELMTNALASTARRTDGYLGLQITGPLGTPFVRPAKDPPAGVTATLDPNPAPAAPPPSSPAVHAPQPTFVNPPSNEEHRAVNAEEPEADSPHDDSALEAAHPAEESGHGVELPLPPPTAGSAGAVVGPPPAPRPARLDAGEHEE